MKPFSTPSSRRGVALVITLIMLSVVTITALQRAQSELERRFQGQPVPRPPHWGGYRVSLDRIEFWQGDRYRLHDRIVYARTATGWSVQRLSP